MMQNPRRLIPFIAFFIFGFSSCTTSNWQTASRESANIAPKPEELTESIYQIYTARAFSWRGYFATHPWIAWKRKDEKQYSVAQVSSWALRRGEKADQMIERALELIKDYPYRDSYTIWPGPNSNTFVEHIIRYTPGATVELPPHAIGKDYLTNSNIFAMSPSGSGIQLSVFGVLGFTLGRARGC